jgi:hypothetical protein
MIDMKRSSLVSAPAIAIGLLLVPAAAYAAIVELGATTATPLVSYMCPTTIKPASCTIILTRATALETVRDRNSYPTKVTKAGNIVAFTVGLSRLSTNTSTARSDISFLDHTYGGTTQVAITVLKQVGRQSQRRWQVVAQSPIFHVQPYLGEVVQFPLATSIPVVPGEVIALTTPTWAPVLVINQPSSRFAYRQSRSANCNNPPSSSQAQLRMNQSATYTCNYPGTRVEYSATEVTAPVAANPIHAPRR